MGCGMGARGSRKGRFRGQQSEGEGGCSQGVGAWPRGTVMVTVPPAEGGVGGVLPGGRHWLCSVPVS